MKVLLLTTCIYNDDNYLDFLRLTNSLFLQDSVDFEHGVLFQNFTLQSKLDTNCRRSYTANFFYINNVISLSKARNYLLDKYLDSLLEYDYVSFPDDDCWYPSCFWGEFKKLAINYDLDVFYTKFSSEPIKIPMPLTKHTTYKLVENASSNTTVYKSNIVRKLEVFDERFGVGSINNGGEDTDFAIRAMLLSKCNLFVNSSLVGHRDPIPEYRYHYFKGSYGVLKIHSATSLSLLLITVRKFLVGLVFLFFNKVKISDFFINKS